eukprot:CAMPEP_0172756244 /NCGR_PEP_ID=MMETSP1074-20121228/161409_1 /TAXON_ID=2916 /ORGANISM="Ceratium fusus, Strain PA161109" /LENGTH=67 /DNA_ID=CAMNT_0013589465 /DNA_START=291 /DNA_END=494 /DNA_ORIENTATION=-
MGVTTGSMLKAQWEAVALCNENGSKAALPCLHPCPEVRQTTSYMVTDLEARASAAAIAVNCGVDKTP